MIRRKVQAWTDFSEPPMYMIRIVDEDTDKVAEIHLSMDEADVLTDQLIFERLIRDQPPELVDDDKSDMLANFIFPFSETIRTDEHRLQKRFCSWLIANGWFIRARFVGPGMDINASFDDHETCMITRLIVECKADKGRHTGQHIDQAYGQLLRRISRHTITDGLAINVDVYYALVVPRTDACINAVRRVSQALRELLRITVYAVDDESQVYEVTDEDLILRSAPVSPR